MRRRCVPAVITDLPWEPQLHGHGSGYPLIAVGSWAKSAAPLDGKVDVVIARVVNGELKVGMHEVTLGYAIGWGRDGGLVFRSGGLAYHFLGWTLRR